MAVETADSRDVFVATDSDEIRNAAQAFGANVIMTSPECANGTERCAEAVNSLPAGYDLIVNLQGDAPLTPAWFLDALITAMANNPDADVATPVLRCDAWTLDGFKSDRAAGRVGGTTAVFDKNNRGLYFSKEVIPYTDDNLDGQNIPVFHHVGVYAYRADALRLYVGWPVGPLERNEGLEQLRFLENGTVVECVEVDGRGRKFWELNNPSDKARIEEVLMELGIE